MSEQEKRTKAERAERRPVGFQGRVVFEDDEWAEVSVVDLSYDGCRIHTPTPLETGRKVVLIIGIRGNIEGTIRWVKGTQAGVLFDAPDRSKEYWPRTADRRDLEAVVTMRRAGQEKYSGIIHDFSTHGCQIEFAVRPILGEEVQLKLPGLDLLTGEVRWVKGERAGIRFSNPIHPAVFELIVGKLTPTKPQG